MSLDRPYEKHVFVCTKGPWCPRDGPAPQVHLLLKQAIKDSPLRDECRVNHAGCLNQCGHGPMVVVYPEGVWYAHVDEEGARRIAEEHLKGGRIVEEYRYRPEHAGGNKTLRVRTEEKAAKEAGAKGGAE